MTDPTFVTAAQLTADLARIGVRPGGILMVHASCNSVGPVLRRNPAVCGPLAGTGGGLSEAERT